jgi:prevent-host-death family protein
VTKTLSLTEVKSHFPQLVTGIQERADEVVVTKNGKPAAIILNVEDYEALKETIEILSDKGLMRRIRRNRRYFARGGKGLSMEEVFGR